MKNKSNNVAVEINIDTTELKNAMHDYYLLIESINFYYDRLEEAIKMLGEFDPDINISCTTEMKKSVKSKSCTLNSDGSFEIHND